MAQAFNFYQPLAATPNDPAVKARMQKELVDMEGQKRLEDESVKRSLAYTPGGFAGYEQGNLDTGAKARSESLAIKLGDKRREVNSYGAVDKAAQSRDQALAMTAGISDRLMNDTQVAAALSQLESGMKEGPYSQAVQQQLVNRQADQTAAAEGVNAEQIRNEAAARGIDPSAALRQGQAQRQQSNVAFQGDMGSRATLANYEAQQNAARGLASARMGQYGQAQQGYGQAANYLANEQFTSPRVSSVQNNSAPNLAFSTNTSRSSGINGSGSSIPNPNYNTSSLPSYGAYTQTNFGGDPTNNQNKNTGSAASYKPTVQPVKKVLGTGAPVGQVQTFGQESWKY